VWARSVLVGRWGAVWACVPTPPGPTPPAGPWPTANLCRLGNTAFYPTYTCQLGEALRHAAAHPSASQHSSARGERIRMAPSHTQVLVFPD